MRLPTLLLAAAASADQFDLRKLQVHRDGDRLRYSYGDKDVSPWHDVPFWADADKTLVHFVCEIPRLTRSKLEIHKSVAGNKLVQDTKGPHPRFYKYSAAVVNYGAISQTWEDPAVANEHTGVGGDNDPIDVLQLNAAPYRAAACSARWRSSTAARRTGSCSSSTPTTVPQARGARSTTSRATA